MIFTHKDSDGEVCTAEGLHIHQCSQCHSTWSHPRPGDDVSYKLAHTCPKPGCGNTQYWKSELKYIKVLDYPWPGFWPEHMLKKEEPTDDTDW